MTLNILMKELAQQVGSDLHLVVGEPPVFRVSGELIRRPEGPILDNAEMESLLLPHVTEAQRASLQQGNDIERSLSLENNRFKMTIFHERGNLAASLRVIPVHVPTMSELGFTKEDHATLYNLTKTRRGLVIISGPTGSGKSTTIASMIEEINQQRAERILTIEDPIEYVFESKKSIITQRNVGEDVPNFAYGLRSAFRSDPDVLLIGETRDLETMMIALSLAETGHLVFSTLHTTTASGAIQRIIDSFPEQQQPVIRQMLATNLSAVVAQRLLPRASLTERVAVQEIILSTPRVRQMIAEGHNDLTVAIEAGRDVGMHTMDDDLVRLVENGTISANTAWFHLQDKERLPRKLALQANGR